MAITSYEKSRHVQNHWYDLFATAAIRKHMILMTLAW